MVSVEAFAVRIAGANDDAATKAVTARLVSRRNSRLVWLLLSFICFFSLIHSRSPTPNYRCPGEGQPGLDCRALGRCLISNLNRFKEMSAPKMGRAHLDRGNGNNNHNRVKRALCWCWQSSEIESAGAFRISAPDFSRLSEHHNCAFVRGGFLCVQAWKVKPRSKTVFSVRVGSGPKGDFAAGSACRRIG